VGKSLPEIYTNEIKLQERF